MNVRKMIAWIACVLILFALAGCSAAMDGSTGNQMLGDGIVKEEVSSEAEASSGLPENRKLIQTVNMHAETENLDTVLQQIDSRIAELGGYVESSDVQNGSAYSGGRYRSASITIRIPAKDLDSFIDKVGKISNVVSSQKTVRDITLSYVATESRMKALQTEETRLLELMAQAKTMEDLLTVQKRLTEVRTELEQVTSALRVFDNQVDYGTVHLRVEEVKEFTEVTEPETVWQRIGVGFKQSLKGVGQFFEELFVFVIVASPYLVLMGLIIVGVVALVRHSNRRSRKKAAKTKDDPTTSA